MSTFTDTELKRTMWAGGIAAVLGVAGILVGSIHLDPRSYWVEYVTAFGGGGWLALGAGLSVLIIALAFRRTSFFDLNRHMSADKFALSFVLIAAATITAAIVAVKYLPDTPISKLPPDKDIRAQVMKDELRWRQLTVTTLAVAGLVIGFFPAYRFFRR